MKYCSQCGAEVRDEAVVCVKCGCSLGAAKGGQMDAPSTGFAVLGFFFPIIGLILWLVMKDQTPMKAKSAGKGALIGVIVQFVMGILWGIVIACAAANMGGYY